MAGRFSPTAPTHTIKVQVREGAEGPGVPAGRGASVGVGWLNANGTMNISLNPGVTLSWDDGLQITAFVRDLKDEG